MNCNCEQLRAEANERFDQIEDYQQRVEEIFHRLNKTLAMFSSFGRKEETAAAVNMATAFYCGLFDQSMEDMWRVRREFRDEIKKLMEDNEELGREADEWRRKYEAAVGRPGPETADRPRPAFRFGAA